MKTLLLVEDNPGDVVLLEEALQETGTEIRFEHLPDGAEALRRLQGPGPLPGLMVVDLNLPGTGGREILRVLREDPRLRDLPVVILSGSRWEREEMVGEGLPPARYLVKPDSFAGYLEVARALAGIMG